MYLENEENICFRLSGISSTKKKPFVQLMNLKQAVAIMDLIMRDSSLFVCLAIDLVWQVSNISIINVSVFYPDPNHKWLSLAFSYLQGYV